MSSFKPNALTKHRTKYLGCTKPSSYLYLLLCGAIIFLKQLPCIIIETPIVIAYASKWLKLVVPGGLCVAQYKASERR